MCKFLRNFIGAGVIALLCLTCTKGNQIKEENSYKETIVSIEKFPQEYKIEGISTGGKNELANPVAIIQSGQFYIVNDEQGDYCYHLLNKDLNKVFSFARRGDGPGLVKGQSITFRQDFTKYGAVYDYKYDRYIDKWMIDFASPSPTYDTILTLNIPESFYNIQNLCMISPTKFVGLGGMAEGKLYIFDLNSKEAPIITPFIPELDAAISKNDKMFKYNGKVSYEPSLKKIVCASSRFNQIEIYTESGELLKQIRLGDLQTPFGNRSETRFYYYDICLDNNRIFALYSGKSTTEMQREYLNNFKTEVHVFDWDGKPVAKIILDRLVSGFTVDTQTQVMIGIDDTKEDQRLVKYKLPKEIF